METLPTGVGLAARIHWQCMVLGGERTPIGTLVPSQPCTRALPGTLLAARRDGQDPWRGLVTYTDPVSTLGWYQWRPADELRRDRRGLAFRTHGPRLLLSAGSVLSTVPMPKRGARTANLRPRRLIPAGGGFRAAEERYRSTMVDVVPTLRALEYLTAWAQPGEAERVAAAEHIMRRTAEDDLPLVLAGFLNLGLLLAVKLALATDRQPVEVLQELSLFLQQPQ